MMEKPIPPVSFIPKSSAPPRALPLTLSLAPAEDVDPKEDLEDPMTHEDTLIVPTNYSAMSVKQLRAACSELGLDHVGKKQDLIDRLDASS